MMAFKVILNRQESCANKEDKEHDWINHHMNAWNTTTQKLAGDREEVGLLTQTGK